MKSEKKFFVRCPRGDCNTLPLSHIKAHWDIDFKSNPEDPLEETLGGWLETAEIGDEFVTEDHIILTRTN